MVFSARIVDASLELFQCTYVDGSGECRRCESSELRRIYRVVEMELMINEVWCFFWAWSFPHDI